MDHDLEFFDNEVNRGEPVGENPMCPEGTKEIWSGRLDSNQRPYGPELITNFARLCLSIIYGDAVTEF